MKYINFGQKCFNFVDRGVMFKVVQKYMGPFQGNLDNQVLHFIIQLCMCNQFISVVNIIIVKFTA